MSILSLFSPAELLDMVISTLLPLAVAFVTHKLAAPGVKAVVLLALAALGGFLTQWHDAAAAGSAFDWSHALATVAVSFIVAVAVHFGWWQSVGVTGASGVIQRAMPGWFGVIGADRGRHEAE